MVLTAFISEKNGFALLQTGFDKSLVEHHTTHKVVTRVLMIASSQ